MELFRSFLNHTSMKPINPKKNKKLYKCTINGKKSCFLKNKSTTHIKKKFNNLIIKKSNIM